MDTCENCGRTIGKLETPFVFNQNVVCRECHTRLAPTTVVATATKPKGKTNDVGLDDIASAVQKEAGVGTIDYASPSRLAPPPTAKPPACPGCGAHVAPVRKAKGSTAVLIILLLLWILPGILYLIFYQGHVYVCPACGMKRGDAQ